MACFEGRLAARRVPRVGCSRSRSRCRPPRCPRDARAIAPPTDAAAPLALLERSRAQLRAARRGGGHRSPPRLSGRGRRRHYPSTPAPPPLRAQVRAAGLSCRAAVVGGAPRRPAQVLEAARAPSRAPAPGRTRAPGCGKPRHRRAACRRARASPPRLAAPSPLLRHSRGSALSRCRGRRRRRHLSLGSLAARPSAHGLPRARGCMPTSPHGPQVGAEPASAAAARRGEAKRARRDRGSATRARGSASEQRRRRRRARDEPARACTSWRAASLKEVFAAVRTTVARRLGASTPRRASRRWTPATRKRLRPTRNLPRAAIARSTWGIRRREVGLRLCRRHRSTPTPFANSIGPTRRRHARWSLISRSE